MLIIIRGLPGSGKSTLAQQISKDHGCPVFEADDFFTHPVYKSYSYQANLIGYAHNHCMGMVAYDLYHFGKAIVANTMTEMWEIQKYVALARATKMKVQVITCVDQYENIHNVDADKMKSMTNRFVCHESVKSYFSHQDVECLKHSQGKVI